MKKKGKKKQAAAIIGLSLLVLLCVVVEAQKKGIITPKISKELKEESTSRPDSTAGSTKKKITSFTENTKVRVLIMTEDFVSLFHKKVQVTSNKPFTVTIDNKKMNYKAGDVVTYTKSNKQLKGKKIVFEPSKGARLKILSVQRQNISPSYRNTLEVTWKKSGLLITNELPVEEYLYAVVPSELSTGHKMEALKAQAVCARSYTYNQMNGTRYEKYNADVDDSVSFQVYNNIPEDKRSRKAVNDTKGLVLKSNGKVVLAYYFSTSWGCTASGQDVWGTKSDIAYLKEKFQITDSCQKKLGQTGVNLSSEQSFEAFLKNDKYETYDSESDWYRWNVTISQKSLSTRMDAALASCYASNPKLILTQTASGAYKAKPLKTLGKIKKIRVEKRVQSGLVTELVIVGSKNVIKICSQYNIRKVLAPVYEHIYYNHAKSTTTMSLLPSAAFYVNSVSNDDGVAFLFTGGGFGHGSGMSQCGAARMAEVGKSYQEILAHYFNGTIVEKN